MDRGLIIRKEAQGEQVTVKTIVDSFQSKPYGWDLGSIEVVTAALVGDSKVTLTVDGNGLKRSEVATALRNTQKHGHIVVSLQKTFDERKVVAFRKFCSDFFDESNPPKDPLELARHGADHLKAKRDELKATVAGSKYPFVEQLSAPISLLDQVVGKADDWYLINFDLGDDLLDAKEDLIDPIQAFLSGGQRSIYDAAAELLNTHSSNLGYLAPGSDAAIRSGLNDPNAFRGNRMAQLKQATDQLSAQIDEKVAANRAEVLAVIDGRKTELEGSAAYSRAKPEAQQNVIHQVGQAVSRVGEEDQIALIRELGTNFEETTYPSLLDLLAASQSGGGGGTPPTKPTVSVKTISASGVTGILETEDDVDRYLAVLRAALIQTLQERRISL